MLFLSTHWRAVRDRRMDHQSPFWARLADASSPQSPVHRAGRPARRTGDWGEKMSAILGQIGRRLFAPVASPELADTGGAMLATKSANLGQIGRPTFETFEKMLLAGNSGAM